VLNTSCNVLITVLKVTNRMAVWVQNGCKCITSLRSWSHDWVGTAAHRGCPASWEYHTASPGKDQNSKCEVQFLLYMFHFCIIIKSENPKLNHCKSRTTLHKNVLLLYIMDMCGEERGIYFEFFQVRYYV